MSANDAKRKIQELVAKYGAVKSSDRISKYSEQDTKDSFIRPMFETLGWDFDNRDEVSKEEFVNSAGRVDYGIYLNNQPKLFIEAKKLGVDIHKPEFAEQAIRYCFNRVVTWAVLTDFESLKVFNAQNTTGSLSDKLYFEIPYTQYLERFDQIWQLSKESFESGLIDQEAMRVGKLQQKITVTEQLAKDLNLIRDILTQKLHQWNEEVSPSDLDEGVQKLLDRLIFLRVAEDRGIEEPILKQLVRDFPNRKDKGQHLYQSMIEKFRLLDEIYNSGLFSPHPFENWQEYSGVTEQAINILYGKSGYYEYDFKFIPSDVLGQVYENYLGHLLNKSRKGLTLDTSAKKRKEQGIYYTPSYIEDYIVEQALKPVLDKCNTIADIKAIKVLDPACGSGSFLIKAMEMIAKKYVELGGRTLDKSMLKINILLDNIYGVDLDEKAVEIARLNLTINSLESRMKLPGLESHIKNGNSLISGSDEELKKYFGKNFRDKKPFNWEEEFPEVFNRPNPGFDVIIGNPPYVFSRENMDESEKAYFYSKYSLTQFKLNTYVLFIEKSFNLLSKEGYQSFIVPNNWLTLEYNSDLRNFILTKTFNIEVINIDSKVFDSASVDSTILFFRKSGQPTITLSIMDQLRNRIVSKSETSLYLTGKNNVISIHSENSSKYKEISDNITQKSIELGTIALVKNGVQAYTVGEGKPTLTQEMKVNRIYHSKKALDQTWIQYVDGVDIARYNLGWSGQYIKYGENLSRPRKFDLFNGKRILVRQIPSKPPYSILASYTDTQIINDNNGIIVKSIDPKIYDIYFILGLLNSKLISFWFNAVFNKFQRKIFPQFKVNELTQFPIKETSKVDQKPIIVLVTKMLQLQAKLHNQEENSNSWKNNKIEIEKTNKLIDQLVYKLYGLTDEEVEVIETKS